MDLPSSFSMALLHESHLRRNRGDGLGITIFIFNDLDTRTSSKFSRRGGSGSILAHWASVKWTPRLVECVRPPATGVSECAEKYKGMYCNFQKSASGRLVGSTRIFNLTPICGNPRFLQCPRPRNVHLPGRPGAS